MQYGRGARRSHPVVVTHYTAMRGFSFRGMRVPYNVSFGKSPECINKYPPMVRQSMGITNLDTVTLDNGLVLSNSYVTLTSIQPTFPNGVEPLSLSWVYDAFGNKSFSGDVTLFTYASKERKDAGFKPLQCNRVTVPADAFARTAFGIVYENIRAAVYTNSTVDDGADFPPPPPPPP